MLQHIRDSNPASKWLGEKFQANLTLANGHLAILRFDLSSAGKPSCQFDTDKVMKHYGDAILVDPETDFGEYLNVASTIADVLNQKMAEVGQDVMGHVRSAHEIVAALSVDNKTDAYLDAIFLAKRLMTYGTSADVTWGVWLQNVIEYAKTGIGDDSLEFGENDLDLF